MHCHGLPRFTDGDEISKEDAEIISEFGFGAKLPSRHWRSSDQTDQSSEQDASDLIVDTDQHTWDDWDDVYVKLEKTSSGSPPPEFTSIVSTGRRRK